MRFVVEETPWKNFEADVQVDFLTARIKIGGTFYGEVDTISVSANIANILHRKCTR